MGTASSEVVDLLVEQKNTFTVVGSDLLVEALGDRIIILEDKFRTGYECKTCDGDGYLPEVCPMCKGAKMEGADETLTLCRWCRPLMAGEADALGHKRCPDCQGKGGLIVVPQEQERRPASGIITSIGPQVKTLKVGERVMYSNFAGNAINFKQKSVMRVMAEKEVMCKLYGTGELGKIIK